MKRNLFNSYEEWLAARRGRVTGTGLKEIVSVGGPTKEMICKVLDERMVEYKKASKKEELEALLTAEDRAKLNRLLPKKIGFYKLIAERLGLPDDGSEKPMDRGNRLQTEALEAFEKETGLKLKTGFVIWERDDDESIAVSPDAEVVGKPEAVECKCLGSAYHIKAWVEQAIPEEYWFQVLQYFIVDNDLEKLHFWFYEPRIPAKPYFEIVVTREQVQADVDTYLAYEQEQLAQVRDIVNQLTF